MNSYIDEFKGDHEKKSDLVITIDGEAGAGKGTLAKQIGEIMGLPVYSAGDFFRDIASEKGLSVEELSEQADKETDLKVDRRTLEKGLNENCVIESRLPSRVLGDYSDLRIYVTADIEERAERIMSDQEEGKRDEEQRSKDIDEMVEKIRKREADNRKRYSEYYGIDLEERDFYDVLMDNTGMSVEDQRMEIKKILEQEFPERFGK